MCSSSSSSSSFFPPPEGTVLKTLLNEAHFLHREAERALKLGKIETALINHSKAAQKLRLLSKEYEEKALCFNEKVVLSLNLQAKFHDKEQILIELRRKNYLKRLAKMENQLMSRDEEEEEDGKCSYLKVPSMGSNREGQSLQNSIYRAFEETEVLLQNLRLQENAEAVEAVVAASKKLDKDDKEIIEELEVTNTHLRTMVQSLFNELEKITVENLELKRKVNQLETQLQENNDNIPPTQSSSLDTSSFHQNHNQLLSLNNNPNLDLPPLELPKFDFTTTDKSED